MFKFIKRWLPSKEEVQDPKRFLRQATALMRREYEGKLLDESTADPDPLKQFEVWYAEAVEAVKDDPNAVLVATADEQGRPSSRVVLLKEYDEQGFVFYTNYASRKGEQILKNPSVAMTFYWPDLMRQVRIEGSVEKVSREQSEAYFRKRPRASQIGAWASSQSEQISSREALEERFRETEEKFDGKEIPAPPNWGGFRVAPHRYEFWQGRAGRLHDRICYLHAGSGDWDVVRLSP